MGGFLGNPALRLLLRLKFLGGLRRQKRRLKQPKHWIFLILGVGIAGSWIASLVLAGTLRSRFHVDEAQAYAYAQLSLFVLLVLTVVGSFSHRGVYLPKDEVELCFTVPVTRSEVVRYRLIVNMLKSLFAAVLFGLGAATRLGNGWYCFVGVFVTFLTIPILGQALSLHLGDAENRLGRLAQKLPLGVMLRVLVFLMILGLVYLFTGTGLPLGDLLSDGKGGTGFSVESFTAQKWVRVLLAPTAPWAHLISARTAGDFFPWLLFAVGVWFLAFEWTARISVDFRETSLSTSADVARRLNRMRRGAFAPGQHVTKTTLGWNVPWFFGRGTFGAVAWNKTTSIVRNSRGPLILSAIVILLVTVLGTQFGKRGGHAGESGAVFFPAAFGTFYLCTGLRFDFRGDLEIMDRVKTWPLRPALLFLATILPEIVLVTLLVFVAIAAQTLWIGHVSQWLPLVIAFQPLATLCWVALDNAVFLYSPVRYTPGEDSALQNMGRASLLMLLRMALLGLVGLIAGGPAALLYYLLEDAGIDPTRCVWIASALAWVLAAACAVVLVIVGGTMLRRFDVARDKPV